MPLVLGPAHIPRLSGAQARLEPWLGVLAAITHGNRAGGAAVTLAALEGLASLDGERATFCFDLIYASLDDAARRALEDLMQPGKHEYKSEFARRYFGAGREEGREEGVRVGMQQAVLALIGRRVPEAADAARPRIEACEDPALLARLLGEIADVRTPAELEQLLAMLPAAR